MGATKLCVSDGGAIGYKDIKDWDKPFILRGHANDNLEEYLCSAGVVWLEDMKLDVVNKTITGKYRHSYGKRFDVTFHLSE